LTDRDVVACARRASRARLQPHCLLLREARREHGEDVELRGLNGLERRLARRDARLQCVAAVPLAALLCSHRVVVARHLVRKLLGHLEHVGVLLDRYKRDVGRRLGEAEVLAELFEVLLHQRPDHVLRTGWLHAGCGAREAETVPNMTSECWTHKAQSRTRGIAARRRQQTTPAVRRRPTQPPPPPRRAPHRLQRWAPRAPSPRLASSPSRPTAPAALPENQARPRPT
jgi:hypothetical protein